MRRPTLLLVPLLAMTLSGCIVNLAGSGMSGSSASSSSGKHDDAAPTEFTPLAPDKVPANAAGLKVVYGETAVTDITSAGFPDVIVRGKYDKAALENVRITAVTVANDGPIGHVSQIQIYNAGTADLELTIRTFALDADGILRNRKEEHQLLRARDIVVPETTGWNEATGSKLRYTIIVE